MSDNVTANSGSGGATFAADDIGGVHYPRTKISIGADGEAADLDSGQATMANSVPVVIASDQSAVAVTVSGVATAANQSTMITSLQLLDDSIFAEDVAAQAADKGIAILAVRRDADTSLVGTDNDYANLQVNANGALKVEVFDGGDTHTVQGTVSVTGVSTAANQTTIIGHLDGVEGSLSTIAGAVSGTEMQVDVLTMPTVTVNAHAVTNAGTFAVQESGAALTALQLIDDPVIADDAAFTPATSKVMMAGFQADESSTDSVDEGDAGAARMTLDRKVIVTNQPHAAGGLSIFRSIDLDESEEEVKGSAGCVYSIWVSNLATSTRFLKFYNATAANVTVGSTTPVITIAIPGNSSDDISGKFDGGGHGIYFDTAICVAATTGVADADTGAPAANDLIVNIFYK